MKTGLLIVESRMIEMRKGEVLKALVAICRRLDNCPIWTKRGRDVY